MDNRHGLLTDLSVTASVGVTEPAAALALLARQHEQQLRPKSVGGDKRLSHARIRRRTAQQRHQAACGAQAWPYDAGARWSHQPLARLPDQSDREEAHRTSVRLGQDHRRLAQDPPEGSSAHRAPGATDRRRLQPVAHESLVSDHGIGAPQKGDGGQDRQKPALWQSRPHNNSAQRSKNRERKIMSYDSCSQ